MSLSNTAIIGHLGRLGLFALDDDRTAGGASSQGGANAITSALTRVTVAAANGSMILRSILTNDAPMLCWVVNDSANAVVVYPFAGENINGSLNAGFSIAAGSFAVFSRIKSTLDWRAAVVT